MCLFLRTLHEEGMYPYHLQPVHALHVGDNIRRKIFCEWISNHHQLVALMFTDEATFTRDGINNCHNWHHWSHENPHATYTRNVQLCFLVNVWFGIEGKELVGPVFLEERVAGAAYLRFLEETLPRYLEDIPLATHQGMLYQMDGEPCHSTRNVTCYLHTQYPGRWIGCFRPVQWPP